MIKLVRDILGVLTGKERNAFRLFCVFDIIITLADIFSIGLLLFILQFYISTNPVIPGFLSKTVFAEKSLLPAGLFLVLFAIKNLLAFLLSARFHKYLSGVTVRLSENCLTQYYQSGFTNYTLKDSSVTIREIAYHPVEYSQHLLAGIQQIITQLAVILFTMAAIIWFNGRLFLILFVILAPAVLAMFYFIRKKLSDARRLVQSSNTISHQYLQEALNGYAEAKVYGRTGFFTARFAKKRHVFSNHLFYSFALQNLPSRFIEIFAVLGLFLLIVLAGKDASIFIYAGAFMAAAYKLIPGAVKLINLTGQVKSHQSILPHLSEATKNSSRELSAYSETITSIEFRDVSFSYGDKGILKNLSFSARGGDFCCITGGSGAGKTSIINLLLGFTSPASGDILINGKKQTPASLQGFYPAFSYIKQQSFLLNETLEKNITLEEITSNPQQYFNSKTKAGIENLFTDEKEITQDGKNISGGQQQRINLARMLYKNAGVLLLDEPLNELDPDSVKKIMNHLKELSSQGKIILFISHDEESRNWCNKTVTLYE